MNESPPDHRLERLIPQIAEAATLLRAWELSGGVSARVTEVEVGHADGWRQHLIVREYGEADLLRNPDVATHEFHVLQIVRAAGVPAPEPYYVDATGAVTGSPLIVVSFVDGHPGLLSADLGHGVAQLAATLATIHRVDPSNTDLSFLPTQDSIDAALIARRPAALDEGLSEGRIRAALDAAQPLPPRNHPVLLHGDFWPGNTLWRDGRLVAVIDWEDAALGDPLTDVANARLELLWAFGPDAMHAFTEQYRALMPQVDVADLHYHDLVAALRPAGRLSQWGLDEQTKHTMRARHKWFVNQALNGLR